MKKSVFYALGLFLISFISALLHVDERSLNYDELATSTEVTYPFYFLVFEYCLNGTLAPLYFIIEKVIVSFLETSQFSLRIFSILLGACVPVLIYFQERKNSIYIAIIASLLSLFSFNLIHLQMEARPYILLIFLSIFYIELLYKIVIQSKYNIKNSLYYILISISIFYTSHAGGLFIVIQTVFFLSYLITLKKFKTLKIFALNSFIVASLYFPWFINGPIEILSYKSWWVPSPLEQENPFLRLLHYLISDSNMILILFFATVFISLFISFRDKIKKKILFYLALIISTILAFYLKSLGQTSIFMGRYLSFLIPLFILLFSYSSYSIYKKNIFGKVFVVIFLVLFASSTIKRNPYKEIQDYKTLFHEIVDVSNTKEFSLTQKNSSFIPFFYNPNFFSFYTTQYSFYSNQIEFPPSEQRMGCGEKSFFNKMLTNKTYLWTVSGYLSNDCYGINKIKDEFDTVFFKEYGILRAKLWKRKSN